MPTYGYRCNKCNHTFEVSQRITEDPLTECEKCDGEVKRLIYPVGIAFKGSGFHINDYKSTSSADSGGGNGTKETKVESAPVKESKAETTPAKETAAVSESK